MSRSPEMTPGFKIYIITDSKLFQKPAAMLRRIRYLLKIAPTGSAAVCLRENHLEDRRLLELAMRLRKLTARRGAVLTVNRRLDVALACDAYGVHLGINTVSIEEAGKLLEGKLIGYSAHDADEAARVFRRGADFVTISPVFSSPGKGTAIGLEGLRATVKRCGENPVFALGGIDASNIPGVFRQGARGVSFIRAALTAQRPSNVIRAVFSDHVV